MSQSLTLNLDLVLFPFRNPQAQEARVLEEAFSILCPVMQAGGPYSLGSLTDCDRE